jgi:uncharacterized protein
MSRRLIVVPRWAGTPAADWYPWLGRELQAMRPSPFEPVVIADMPNPSQPTIQAWTGRVKEMIGNDPAHAANTVFVAHSVGCLAVLHGLAELPDGVQIGGLLCVAGWFRTDAPWDSLMPWIETPIDLARAKIAAGHHIAVLISDNDRHVADWRANRKAWEEGLDASVALVPGANHFNGEQYPVILQTLLDNFAIQGE